jgi:hypothetical protein
MEAAVSGCHSTWQVGQTEVTCDHDDKKIHSHDVQVMMLDV